MTLSRARRWERLIEDSARTQGNCGTPFSCMLVTDWCTYVKDGGKSYLHLLCTHGTPVGKNMGCWLALCDRCTRAPRSRTLRQAHSHELAFSKGGQSDAGAISDTDTASTFVGRWNAPIRPSAFLGGSHVYRKYT